VVTCNKILVRLLSITIKNLNTYQEDTMLLSCLKLLEGDYPSLIQLKLVASGDQVNKIQAVLSGSLNFIFNNFDENNSFEK
jgi:aspartokinase/homoserine dehydrogenase 1